MGLRVLEIKVKIVFTHQSKYFIKCSTGFFDKQFGTNATGFQQTLFGGFNVKYYDDESIGYSTTKYLTGGNDGSQRIGSLHYSSNGSTLTYANDHAFPFFPFGDGGDRFRTAAMSFTNSGITVGFKLFTEDYGLNDKQRESTRGPGSNYEEYDKSKALTQIYRAGILYGGYGGYQIGWNSDGIRDFFQYNAHRYLINGIPYLFGIRGIDLPVGYFQDHNYDPSFYFQQKHPYTPDGY
jgi:hypothetical protein